MSPIERCSPVICAAKLSSGSVNYSGSSKRAGGTMDEIVKTTVYLIDGVDRSVFLDAYTEQFRRR